MYELIKINVITNDFTTGSVIAHPVVYTCTRHTREIKLCHEFRKLWNSTFILNNIF